MKNLKNQSGQLAVVMILSIAALASGLLVWKHIDSTRNQYRRLKSSNELTVVGQMVLAAAKSEMMRIRAPGSSLLPQDLTGKNAADFRVLNLGTPDIAYSITGTTPTPAQCALHTSFQTPSLTNWLNNILCTVSGTTAVPLDNAGAIALKISTLGPPSPQSGSSNAYTRPVNISVTVDTKTGPGIFPFHKEIVKNFAMTMAVGNQFGVVLADAGETTPIKINGLGSATDQKIILAGGAPGVVFDGKVLVNAGASFDPGIIAQGNVVYQRVFTNAPSVALGNNYILSDLKKSFLNGIETHTFNTATTGFDYLGGLFSLGLTNGLDEQIYYKAPNSKITSLDAGNFRPTDPTGTKISDYNPCGPMQDTLLNNYYDSSIAEKSPGKTCNYRHDFAVIQSYGKGDTSITFDTQPGNNKFCGLIATNTLTINLPSHVQNTDPEAFAIIGNVIAKKIIVKFNGTADKERLYFLNPFDNHELPNGIAFSTGTQSLLGLLDDFQLRSSTITRRFVGPSTAPFSDGTYKNQLIINHGFGLQDASFQPYLNNNLLCPNKYTFNAPPAGDADQLTHTHFLYPSLTNPPGLDVIGFTLEDSQ